MKNVTRQWFQLSKGLIVCIDFELRSPVATVEKSMRETLSIQWTPNQDADLYMFRAKTGALSKEFRFNPHNEEDAYNAMVGALKWCTDMLGPSVTYVSSFQFVVRCAMFWKYKLLWEKGKIVGVTLRTTDSEPPQQKIDEEWASIKRGFDKQ